MLGYNVSLNLLLCWPKMIHCAAVVIYIRGIHNSHSFLSVCLCVCLSVCPTAMSFPATGMESAYRNNLKDVAKMLKTKHEENYMVSLVTSYVYIP